MDTSSHQRLPLLELALDPFMEGGSKGATPKPLKSKGTSTGVKRARSPAIPSTSSGTDNWLSPSKRRGVRETSQFLSPDQARTSGSRALLSPTEHESEEDDRLTALHESPVRRALFSARGIEPGVITAFAAAHTTPGRSIFASPPIVNAAKTTTTVSLAALRDDVTVVDTQHSSPATLASANSTPRRALFSQPVDFPAAGAALGGLAPSPEILTKPTSARSTSVPGLAPAHTIIPQSSKAKAFDIPSTYSSNPALRHEAYARPTLEESMTLVKGSKHYPGFVVRADSPRSASQPSAARASSREVSPYSYASSSSSDSEGDTMDEDEDEDKENVKAVPIRPIASTRSKKTKAVSASSSRASTPLGEVAEAANTPRPAERISKRPRTTPAPASPVAIHVRAPSLSQSKSSSRGSPSKSSRGGLDAGRDAMVRRSERRRLLEMEVDNQL